MTADATGTDAADTDDPGTDATELALDRGLPGGIAVSRLRVYDWEASDGLRGGSPHLHTASTEGYVVVGGHGEVQTLGSRGVESTPLEPGTIAWFTPGTVHRLINSDGRLDIVTLMSNAGLPEAGDAVLTFPLEVLSDAERYLEHAVLPATDDPIRLESAARERRDLALAGFAELCERAATDLPGTLRELNTAAAVLVAPRIPQWQRIVTDGPTAQTDATIAALTQLAQGSAVSLEAAGIRAIQPEPVERWGMCGRLTVWKSAAH
ncbi:MAG TPA: cupin domain-containing protein [Humibacter sp.]|nr:cupin domain-containing protein [Humibacter sp.]